MKRSLFLLLLCISASRTALAVTCGGFSIVPAGHVVVKYSSPIAAGASRSTPLVSMSGNAITVTRTLSGGSATDVSCVDDTVDLGTLAAGRFDLTWNDNVNLTTNRSTFTLFAGAPVAGDVSDISVLPPTLPGHPVRLAVKNCSEIPAVAYRSGKDIRVSQYAYGLPCKLSVIDVGVLPEATYDVTATFASTEGVNYTTSFAFIVQQPAPPSACRGTFSVTRSPSGTARLHFENTYQGYTPVFGEPAVTELADFPRAWPPSVTVVQPITDSADSAASGAPPASTVCQAEELDLGPLPDGTYDFRWYNQLSVNGADLGLRPVPPYGFLLQNGRVQCTSVPELQMPSPALEGVPFFVGMNLLAGAWQVGSKVTVSGHTITVDLSTFYEGPGDKLTTCQTYGAAIGALPAGDYTVVWRDVGHALWTMATGHLTVARPTRQRAARH